MKDNSLIKKQEKKPISQRIILKVKIKNLSSNCTKPRCERFYHNISKINEDNLFSEKSVLREIKHSRNFHFGNEQNNNSFEKQKKILSQDLSEFDLNTKLVTKTLKSGLTKTELNDAKKDLNYYLPDVRLKNLKLFKNESLSALLNAEEAKNNFEKDIEDNDENKDIFGEKILNLKTEKSSALLSRNEDDPDFEEKLKLFKKRVSSGIMINKEREMKLKKIKDNLCKDMNNLHNEAIKEVKEYLNKNGYGYGIYFQKNKNINLNDINLNNINLINNNKYENNTRNKKIDFSNKAPVKLPRIITKSMNIEENIDAKNNNREKSGDKRTPRRKKKRFTELKKMKIKEKKNEQNLINEMNQQIKLIYLSKNKYQ